VNDPRRSLLLVAVLSLLALVALACGGGGTSSAPASGGASAPASAEPGSAEPASADPSAAASADASGGGTGSGVACDLISVADAETLTGVTGITTDDAGLPSTCLYLGPDSQTPLLRLILLTDSVDLVYDGYAADSSAVPISGLGDAAVWVPNQSSLFVKKGGVLLQIAPGDGSDQTLAEAAARAAAEGL
jgi:hypothetical protein